MFTRYLTTPSIQPTWPAPVWAYAFPNGHTTSVTVDPRPEYPFRFEVLSSDPADRGQGGVVAGLTSEQVEAKLAHLHRLPALNEENQP